MYLGHVSSRVRVLRIYLGAPQTRRVWSYLRVDASRRVSAVLALRSLIAVVLNPNLRTTQCHHQKERNQQTVLLQHRDTNCHGQLCEVLTHSVKADATTCRVEKFRPRVLDDVVGNTDTIERLKVIAKDGNCPHIIISVRRLSSFANGTT